MKALRRYNGGEHLDGARLTSRDSRRAAFERKPSRTYVPAPLAAERQVDRQHKQSSMRTLIVLGSFVLLYLLGAEAINYVAVYRLDIVDPKFGDAEGNFHIGRELSRYLTALATVSFVAGIWPHRTWFPSASTTLLGIAAMGCALICTIIWLAGLYLDSKLLSESVSGELWPISWFVLFGLPMLCGRKVFTLIRPQVLPASQ